MKGLTLPLRLERLKALLLGKYNWYAETDYSAFDSTVHLRLRELEHLTFKRHFDAATELAYVVLVCLSVIVHVDVGVSDECRRLVIPSLRYSGEPGTSIGNGLINDFVAWSCPSDVARFSFAEGDDGFVGATDRFDLSGWALSLGLNLECDWHEDYRDVKFCGRYVVGDFLSPNRTYADVRRAIEKVHLVTGSNVQDRAALLRGKCIAGLSLDPRTPAVSSILWAHLQRAGAGPVIMSDDDKLKFAMAGSTVKTDMPLLDVLDYQYLLHQGLSPKQFYDFDVAMLGWAVGLCERPMIDFVDTKVKVDMVLTSQVSGAR